VSAHGPRSELLFSEGDAEGDREHLVGALRQLELFRRAADKLAIVEYLCLDDSIVSLDTESAATLVNIVVAIEAASTHHNISVAIIGTR